jgi:FolB domain-containing protein
LILKTHCYLEDRPEYDGDVIHIEQIEILAHIGVPDDECSQPQRLTISIAFWPNKSGPELNDDIARAVNYADVCAKTKKFVAARRDKLSETLADALAMAEFALAICENQCRARRVA